MKIRAIRNCMVHHGADEWEIGTGGIYELPDEVGARIIGEGLAVSLEELPDVAPPAVESAPDKILHADKTKRKYSRRRG